MGSQLKTDLAYIAGFLDGDGSLMLQIKKRSDTKRGIRFMATICLYQDTRHEKPLLWFRSVFGIGYISRRKDGMTELRINGYKQVREILTKLQPYIRFKEKQTKLLIRACDILLSKQLRSLSDCEIKNVADCALEIRDENYASRKKMNKEELYQRLGLTP